MSYPHIVSDSEGTIHLTYDDDMFDPHIIYKFNDGINWDTWSDPDTIDLDNGHRNLLVADNNNRLYCFWHWASGTVYYRYLDVGNNEWSEVFNPCDSAMFLKIIVGGDNSLNIMGDFNPMLSYSRITYFKFNNDAWSIPEIIGSNTILPNNDMVLDNQLFPHFVWCQHVPGVAYDNDSIMYRYKTSEGWSVPELINCYGNFPAIVIDNFNRKYIIQVENINESFYLKEYKKINDEWEVSTIDENNYTFYHNRLLCKNGYIYFINVHVDTVIGPSGYTKLIFRKKEILTSLQENDEQSGQLLQNVPNPFTYTTTIEYTLEEDAFVSLIIFDFTGKKIKSLNLGSINHGSHLTTFYSSELRTGIYLYALEINGRLSQMKKMIKTE